MDVATQISPHVAGLMEIVGARYVMTQETSGSPYLRDWSGDYVSSPLCVVTPASTDEVANVVRYCATHQIAVVPQGGNTGLVGGCYTTDDQSTVILNTKRLNRIRNLDGENYTIEVEAGCILQDVQDAAAALNRLFAVSFGAQGSAQVGGAIATNAGGLNVLRYGMVRDMILGLEVVLPDGRVLDCQSTLRKDNRGPDLKQLFVGSEGTFGIVTAATFKLFPYPTHKETALLALESVDDVVKLYGLAREHSADLLSAFELVPRACMDLALDHQSGLRDPLDDTYEVYVLMDLAASGPLDLRSLLESLLETAMAHGLVLDGALAESVAQSEAMWAIREAMVEAQAAKGRHLRTDISVPVTALPEFITKAHKAVRQTAADWTPIAYGHIGDGNVHFNVLPPKSAADEVIQEKIPELLRAIYRVLDQFHGSISAEHGIGRSRKAEFEQRLDAPTRNLGRKFKLMMDPDGIMNDGCLFPPVPEIET